MSTLFKNKILTGSVILLLIANIATIFVFWMGMRKTRPAPQQPFEYIIQELSLNDKQQEQYKAMVRQHREQSTLIQQQVRSSKDSFFNLLANENVNDSIKNYFATKLSSLDRTLELVTFDHFKQVRKICTPDQQKKFDLIIKDVLRMMAEPRPGRHGDRPPPGGGMPPPGDGPPPPAN